MKREIWRNYPVVEKVELVEALLERGVLADGRSVTKQPGRCCVTGCTVRDLPGVEAKPTLAVSQAAE
jgi:4-hydroxybutyryl-CoA dehydratase/vinylacetyl-CoA-Delta-isomerase